MEQKTTAGPRISVIIPVFNETAIINGIVRHVRDVAEGPVEIVVADGGSGYRTLAAVADPAVIRVESLPGRGIQMNAGAKCATGDILLFLHADTLLPQNAFADIRRAVKGGAVGGAFSLSIDSPRLSLGIVSWFANWRTRLERVPYGDQAQFILTETFRDLGGFADVPIMEDVELFQRIRRRGLPISVLRATVNTSPRRWNREGVLRRTLKNWWMRVRYALGASPQELVRQYRPGGSEDEE
ncbi:TIGR04283 family arsenosugar biosynthesis glycosyltransferase [uncultured Pseudodesulfovibrio sp.]|uniref:TIGR04283 family arsenosugar biosynthesis glycosyltransferase n=1 Tax=uncultured Pseudodesulfovibrio sp. TaxID=2035858 RepID=UPI0029C702B0|nr:TIGR04283 family arsenosugar biosynthesis glycosyltransferase [uncultured Pseudodesulfovibrio sp.]